MREAEANIVARRWRILEAGGILEAKWREFWLPEDWSSAFTGAKGAVLSVYAYGW